MSISAFTRVFDALWKKPAPHLMRGGTGFPIRTCARQREVFMARASAKTKAKSKTAARTTRARNGTRRRVAARTKAKTRDKTRDKPRRKQTFSLSHHRDEDFK